MPDISSFQINSVSDKKKLHHKLITQMGEAFCDFDMLTPNDKVLVGVSGGKDSLTLLKLILERRRLTPFDYEVIAIHVVPKFQHNSAENSDRLQNFIKDWGAPLEVVPLDIEMELDPKKMGSSCFWCSWNRRKVFFEAAERLGCTKVALGHHKDDLVETTLMNLFYQGNFKTMLPKQSYFDGEFEMIRPLCYMEEDNIIQFAVDSGFPMQTCECAVGDVSYRKKTKTLLDDLSKDNKSVKSNIFQAAMRQLRGGDGSEV